jgi:hypothetical protein
MDMDYVGSKRARDREKLGNWRAKNWWWLDGQGNPGHGPWKYRLGRRPGLIAVEGG